MPSLHFPPPNPFCVNGGFVASATNSTLTDTNQAWTTNQFAGFYVFISYGTGRGQLLLIASNTATALTVSANWAQNPDSTSEYYIMSAIAIKPGNPFVQSITFQKAESAADTNVLTWTPPPTAGSYKLNVSITVTAANAATLGWTATWKNAGGIAKTPTNLFLQQIGGTGALTVVTSAAVDITGTQSIDIDNSATNIVIQLTFSGTSFSALVTAWIERVN